MTWLGRYVDQKNHEYLYWEFYEQGSKQALRSGKWKAIRRPLGTGLIEVYDLSKDIVEEVDLAEQRPDLVARFRKIFDQAHVPVERWLPKDKPRSRAAERAEIR